MDQFNEELFFAEEDCKTVAFIQGYLPQDVKDKFSEDELYYFLDAFAEYCETAGLMDDDAEEAEIDIEAAADFMVVQAKKEKIGNFDAEDVRWVVDGQLEFWETQE